MGLTLNKNVAQQNIALRDATAHNSPIRSAIDSTFYRIMEKTFNNQDILLENLYRYLDKSFI